jgi:hypothetical protein
MGGLVADDSGVQPVGAAPSVAEVGPVTAQEDALRTDARRFRVVAIVAGVLLLGPVMGQVWYMLSVIPSYAAMYAAMGGELPPASALVFGIGTFMAPLFVIVDALVFWGFCRLARRYWIGLLFAPLFAVPMITAAVLIPAVYLPATDIINLVK